MTTKQPLSEVGFTRCAVCKIDLKGRFVYLDEKVENLLGCTKEQLFGKSFLEFLDEPSQRLIEQLLSHRNHYETFFDTTTISILNRSGGCRDMRAVVSLNFIAGNPVNYQLIIDCDESLSPIVSQGRQSDQYGEFIHELMSLESLDDWKVVLRLLCRLVGANQACVYLASGEELQPRSAVCEEADEEFVFNKIPEAGELHLQVARTGEEYSFIDQQAVRKVIEQSGTAPNEYVSRHHAADGNDYVVRLLFPDELDHQSAQAAIEDARTALKLIFRLMNAESPYLTENDNPYDIKFTVGFLDSLGIAAFLTDREGSIVGYNPATLNILSDKHLEGSYLNAIKHLADINSTGLKRSVIDYINSSIEDENYLAELAVSIKISPSDNARLTVMKLGDDAGDLSACFVIVPEAVPDESATMDSMDYRMWRSVFRQFRKCLDTTESVASQLGHEFYNELGDGGNAHLCNLTGNVKQLKGVVSEFYQFTRLMNGDKTAHMTDLNLLVEEQLRELKASGPGSDVRCHYKKLPKIKTRPKLLSFAVNSILSNCVHYNDKPTTEIKITATVTDGQCELIISDNGFGIAPKHLPKVFEALYRVSDKNVQKVPGYGLGLTFAKKTIQALGGETDIASTVGEGSEVRITLPTE